VKHRIVPRGDPLVWQQQQPCTLQRLGLICHPLWLPWPSAKRSCDQLWISRHRRGGGCWGECTGTRKVWHGEKPALEERKCLGGPGFPSLHSPGTQRCPPKAAEESQCLQRSGPWLCWEVVSMETLERDIGMRCLLLELPQRPNCVTSTKSLLVPEEHIARCMINSNGATNQSG